MGADLCFPLIDTFSIGCAFPDEQAANSIGTNAP